MNRAVPVLETLKTALTYSAKDDSVPQAAANLPSRLGGEQGRHQLASEWLNEREDRPALVAWLAAASVRTCNTFLHVALRMLLSTGSLPPAVEAAVRSCREREQRRTRRYSPAGAVR